MHSANPSQFFPAFLSRVVRNFAIDKYKSNTGKKRISSELTESLDDLLNYVFTDNTAEFDLKILSDLIGEYLRGVSHNRRRVFFGRFYYGDTLSQIAAQLGISTATVGREIEKIKQELREFLKRNGVYV